tara:strand:+ start:55 stop:258 length:204 start_codon:yes stop_codon:yes gene_type:complete
MINQEEYNPIKYAEYIEQRQKGTCMSDKEFKEFQELKSDLEKVKSDTFYLWLATLATLVTALAAFSN